MRSGTLSLVVALAACGTLTLTASAAHAWGHGQRVVSSSYYYAPAYYAPAYSSYGYYGTPVYSSSFAAPTVTPVYTQFYAAPTAYYYPGFARSYYVAPASYVTPGVTTTYYPSYCAAPVVYRGWGERGRYYSPRGQGGARPVSLENHGAALRPSPPVMPDAVVPDSTTQSIRFTAKQAATCYLDPIAADTQIAVDDKDRPIECRFTIPVLLDLAGLLGTTYSGRMRAMS